MSMDINETVKECHEIAKSKGFYDKKKYNSIGYKLMLIVSELGETLEAHRKNKFADKDTYIKESVQIDNKHLSEPNYNNEEEDHNIIFKKYMKDTFEDEIADTVIRIFDMCGWLGIDLEEHISAKMRYNQSRPYKHGKKY